MSSSASISKRVWDFVVIGAGPAGALAAYQLARQHQSVLLLDQAEFPRNKVCGGCLSGPALRLLEELGLGALPRRLGSKPFRWVRFTARRQSLTLPVPEGASLSRKKLDYALIQEAQSQGAAFLPKAKARLLTNENGPARIHVLHGTEEWTAEARMAIVSDGLSGTALGNLREAAVSTQPGAWVGLSASLENFKTHAGLHAIEMISARGGYVGITRDEDQRFEIAAAVSPKLLKEAGTPARCITQLLHEAGFSFPQDFSGTVWQGSPSLRRSRKRVSGRRYFILGDSAGFAEPFTGEGIYWALLQAKLLTDLLAGAGFEWNAQLTQAWQEAYTRKIRPPQVTCMRLTALLRLPLLYGWVLRLLRRFPGIAAPLIERIHGLKP